MSIEPTSGTARTLSGGRTGLAIALAIVSVFAARSPLGAVSRFQAVLAGGDDSVTVDNASPWPDAVVQQRVAEADRSTQGDCRNAHAGRRGLFEPGDRIVATRGYLAWFDLTIEDRERDRKPDFPAIWARSGALAGWWTMAEDGDFLHKVSGPRNCLWAPNELLPGSASKFREQNFWDRYAPPHEHSLEVKTDAGRFFFAHSLSGASPKSRWRLTKDGWADPEGGVTYRTSARLASLVRYNIDVTDNDDRSVANFIRSRLTYRCLPDRIIVSWKITPRRLDVVSDNLFAYLWLSYAQDMDGTSCDLIGRGSQWPSEPPHVYAWAAAGAGTAADFTLRSSPGGRVSNPQRLVWGKACGPINTGVVTSPDFAVGDGTRLTIGRTRSLSADHPRFRWTNLGVPNSGAGTKRSPSLLAWDRLILWNEALNDGVVGFGATRGPYYSRPDKAFTLVKRRWYEARYELSSTF